MTTCADWKAALAANPRDPQTWLLLAEYLTEHPEAWEREKCEQCNHPSFWRVTHFPEERLCPACKDTGYLAMTAHLARLTWWRLMMEDERWHGVEQSIRGPMRRMVVPTFALLFDREEVIDPGKAGRNVVYRSTPGHVSELAAYLESMGDKEAAERVRGIRVAGHDAWVVLPIIDGAIYATYADACREAIRRIVAVFTKECQECDGDGADRPRQRECEPCFGLGFVITEGSRNEQQRSR